MSEGWTWRSTLRLRRGGPSWHPPPPPCWSNEPSLARSVTAEGTWAPPNTTPLLLSAPAIKIMSVSVQPCDMLLHKKNWCTHFKIMSLSVICCCCTRRTVAPGIRLLGLYLSSQSACVWYNVQKPSRMASGCFLIDHLPKFRVIRPSHNWYLPILVHHHIS